jgi:hypothetical protein
MVVWNKVTLRLNIPVSSHSYEETRTESIHYDINYQRSVNG